MNIQSEYKKNSHPEPKVSTEQKLALIRTVRMQHQYNRNQCRERERIIYGQYKTKSELFASENSMALSPAMKTDAEGLSFPKTSFFSGFRLRFLLAACLFVLYLFADNKQIELFQKDTGEILQLLQENFEIPDKIQAWNIIDL